MVYNLAGCDVFPLKVHALDRRRLRSCLMRVIREKHILFWIVFDGKAMGVVSILLPALRLDDRRRLRRRLADLPDCAVATGQDDACDNHHRKPAGSK
jgi:hypothetical protein